MPDDPGSHFVAMVQRLGKIEASEFAGAVVIVPPNGDPISILISEAPRPDLPQFWSIVKTRVEIRMAEAIQDAQSREPWRR